MKAIARTFAAFALGALMNWAYVASAETVAPASRIGVDASGYSVAGKLPGNPVGAFNARVFQPTQFAERCMEKNEFCCPVDAAGLCKSPNPTDSEAVGCCAENACVNGKCTR